MYPKSVPFYCNGTLFLVPLHPTIDKLDFYEGDKISFFFEIRKGRDETCFGLCDVFFG